MGVEVVRAGLEHVAALAPLFDAYRQFYGQPSNVLAGGEFLTARMRSRESVVLIAVSEESSQVVGFVQLYPCFSSEGLTAIWLLNDLFVAPEARRNGAARMLLAKAVELARSTGASRIRLSTASSNEPAKALYLASGYRLTEFDQFELTV